MRVRFLVDGFNVYHSLRAAERQVGGNAGLRWLDLRRLCETLVRSGFGPGATLQDVTYFSALAHHLGDRSPSVVIRHRLYIDALRATGVRVRLGSFKAKDRHSPLDRFLVQVHPFRRRWQLKTRRIWLHHRTHEEKETDVAIASMLFAMLHHDPAVAVVLVTGDTDLVPAVHTARTLHAEARVCVAFPFKRHNRQLAEAASQSMKLSAAQYWAHQFEPVLRLANGRTLRKPDRW